MYLSLAKFFYSLYFSPFPLFEKAFWLSHFFYIKYLKKHFLLIKYVNKEKF